MKETYKQLKRDETGQAITEYAFLMLILVLGVAIVVFAADSDLGNSIKNLFVVTF